jgi:(p)ppGpp synthase/HD superfamily hydrolase
MTALPAVAAELAETFHKGQVDKAGQPYIEHLARVVAILIARFPSATPSEIEAAWLHDALEDTTATADSLLQAGISTEAVEMIRLVTKPEGVNYLDWITALAASGNLGAIRVKLADNEDNQDPARVAALPGAEHRVKTRYAPARQILLRALG